MKEITSTVFDRLWNDRDPSALREHTAPDVRMTVALPGRAGLTGAREIEAFVEELRAGIPDARRTTHAVHASGDQVMVRAEMTGTQRGFLLGVPPTGRPVTLTEMLLLRVDGDRITEVHQQADYLGVLGQLGLTPPEGAGPVRSVLHTFATVGRLGGLMVKHKLSGGRAA